jgi:uncharacterized membrane protein
VTVEVNQSMPNDRSRYLFPGFIASLAVNLLFVGVVLAAVWHRHFEEAAPPPPDKGFLGFVDKLAPDRQSIIKDKILAARASMKDLRADMRKKWIDANGLLDVEPYDKAKFLAALMALRASEDSFKNAIYNSVAETAEDLTPDERKLLLKWREKRHMKILMPPPPPEPSDGKASN